MSDEPQDRSKRRIGAWINKQKEASARSRELLAAQKSQRDAAKKERIAQPFAEQAREAAQRGDRFYLLRWSDLFRADSTRGLTDAITAVEDAGWELDQMSWYYHQTGLNSSVGMFLFRRVTPNEGNA